MQKNDELILKIEDMGVDGAGIGKSDGMTFFVKDAVIGDVVRAKIIKLKKTYGFCFSCKFSFSSMYQSGSCLQFCKIRLS